MMRPARNPFEAPPSTALLDATGRAGGGEAVEGVERVEKPWGHEEIFAVLEGGYVGKVLHIVAGGTLSLQLHRAKTETIAVQSGLVEVEHGPDAGRLANVTLRPGQRLLIRPHVVHRISATEDSVVLETSTALPGWRTDVVRLEDRYGRGGTDAP